MVVSSTLHGLLEVLSVLAYCVLKKKNIGSFDKYVRPPRDAVCSTQCSAVHGLSCNSEKIKSASSLEDVWPLFVEFIESKLDNGQKVGIICAWGGQACDCEWLFRITEETHVGLLKMPRWCPYSF